MDRTNDTDINYLLYDSRPRSVLRPDREGAGFENFISPLAAIGIPAGRGGVWCVSRSMAVPPRPRDFQYIQLGTSWEMNALVFQWQMAPQSNKQDQAAGQFLRVMKVVETLVGSRNDFTRSGTARSCRLAPSFLPFPGAGNSVFELWFIVARNVPPSRRRASCERRALCSSARVRFFSSRGKSRSAS